MKRYLNIHELDGALLVEVLEPRFDARVADALTKWLRNQPIQAPNRVILYLGAVEFMDSSGLGAVVRLWRDLRETQDVRIAGLRPNVRELLCMARLDYVLPTFDDLEDAIVSA